MIIKNVQLSNYGPFKGSHSIDLALPSIKRVTLIGGLNGSGKTSIFESIQLCLFGSQSNLHKENRRVFSYSKFLEAKINRDSPPDTRCAVTMTLNLSDDTDYQDDLIIQRSWIRSSKGVKEELEVTRNGMIDTFLTENWIEYISTIISPSLSKLFLFDGEKILKYAEPAQTSKLLIQGIETLIGADLVTNLEDDLALLKKNILKESNPDMNSELDETELKIDSHKKALESNRKKLEKLEENNHKNKKNYEEIEIKFRAKGIKSFEKIEALEKQVLEYSKEIELIQKDQVVLASGVIPLKLARKNILAIRKLSEAEQTQADLNSKIDAWSQRDEQVLNILKDIGSPDINDLKKLLKTSIDNERLLLKVTDTKIESKIYELDSIDEQIKLDIKKYISNKKKLDQLDAKVAACEKAILRAPDDNNAKNLLSKRDELLKKISIADVEINNLKEEIKTSENALISLEGAYKRQFDEKIDALHSSSIQKSQLEKIKIAEKNLISFKQRVISESINSFESQIVSKFQFLNRKDSLISSIKIDKDTYIIEAVNKDQKIVGLEDLSAGERQLLAISIVWTLSEVSKVNVPIVIDTPLGRLDSKHREQLITKYFPQAGAQTIILSTDEEIIGKYYKSLKPYIGNEYLCTENEKAQSGKILRGYFK